MDVIGIVMTHGYLVAGFVLFLSAAGLPLPVGITLLAAGAAAHAGLTPHVVWLVAWFSALAGDTLLYLGGRLTGWWLLGGICRLSVNPEQCIFRSAEMFYQRGAKTLLVAKFIPGLATVAAALAGSLNMRWKRFLMFMAAGEALYCSTWLAVGYLFHRFIRSIAFWIERAGHAVLLAVALLAAGYGLVLFFYNFRSRRFNEIEKITADGLRERVSTLDPNHLVIIADVRSHNYYDPGMLRIKNSIRVEPNRLHEELVALREFMAPECEIYLYCSCIRDTTSVRVAHALQQANCQTKVIEGGLKAWVRAGGEVEPVPEGDIHHLPQFN